jgi:hypothetical protein
VHINTGGILMRIIGNKAIYIALAGASAVFLWIHYQTHIEFMLHLGAIPLEALVVVFIVERILDNRAIKERRKQLMFVKSCMFRDQMRDLFISNLRNVKYPELTLSKIRNSELSELRELRNAADSVTYKSIDEMENIIMEYVKAEHVWERFLEIAINYNFEGIIHDMTNIQHFTQDVRLFKRSNPDKLYIHEARKNKQMMDKVDTILGDGIRKFLDYLIELKEKQPELFYTIISDYEASAEKFKK